MKKRTLEQHWQVYDLYYSKICELEEKGLLIQKADKTVITFSILAMMNWIIRWFNPTGRLSIEEVAENVIGLFFRSILKKEFSEGEELYDLTSRLKFS